MLQKFLKNLNKKVDKQSQLWYYNYRKKQTTLEREVLIMTVVRYRLIFRDGSHGAWETDFKRIQESAEFFKARIEKWVVELP